MEEALQFSLTLSILFSADGYAAFQLNAISLAFQLSAMYCKQLKYCIGKYSPQRL